MKQRYYSNMSDENLQPPTMNGTVEIADYRPPLPPRTPLSPPDEAEEHTATENPENVKRTSYFPLQPVAEQPVDTKEGSQGLNDQNTPIRKPPSQHQASHEHRTEDQNQTQPREGPKGLNGQLIDTSHLPPPQRQSHLSEQTRESYSPTSWHRSLTILTAFLVPYPKPQLPPVSVHTTSQLIPPRFMIYTPPPAPFLTKPEGESKTDAWRKEGIPHFCRRKWYEELREAKMRQPKDGNTTKWKRAKWRATKGTDWGIDKTKSTNLEFLNRVARLQDESNAAAEDVYAKQVSPEELVLLHPPVLRLTIDGSHDHDEELLRENFTASLLRTKKRALRDTIISALLFPPAIVIDTVAVPIWPFGGLAEIDAGMYSPSKLPPPPLPSHELTSRPSLVLRLLPRRQNQQRHYQTPLLHRLQIQTPKSHPHPLRKNGHSRAVPSRPLP